LDSGFQEASLKRLLALWGRLGCALGFAAVALLPASASAAARVRQLPVGPGAQPFGAAASQVVPFDLKAHGYVEEEFLVEGSGKVFDWPDGWRPGAALAVVAEGPYVTRILVRRPIDMRRWSGSVVVEPYNASLNIDNPIMWAESYEHFLRERHVWVGVTIKPNTLAALKRFDAKRYAAVGMANPRPSPCSEDDIKRLAMPSSTRLAPQDEIGLAWQILTDVGLLLKSNRKANPLGKAAVRLYMTGQSQSASYVRTYASLFGRIEKSPNGRFLYDGYLYSGGRSLVPLNQCVSASPPGLDRLVTLPAGAPVIEMYSEGDVLGALDIRREDSDARPDQFRRYEVAGSSHADLWEERSKPNEADAARAGLSSSQSGAKCTPEDVKPGDFPIRYAFNGAWANLDRWVRTGVAAPHAQAMEVVKGPPMDPVASFKRDPMGNALGGLRLPEIDAPRATWVGGKSGDFGCSFRGYERPFGAEALRALYPTASAYPARLRAVVKRAVASHWVTAADGEQILLRR
jgi:hypothetical protein